nr:MAG TPA: hypothetical protein [Caudoviricetes sp.]
MTKSEEQKHLTLYLQLMYYVQRLQRITIKPA